MSGIKSRILSAHVSRLANGLRVATVEMPQAQSVSVGLWVGIGGRHEPDRFAGISHFIEHLLFKGTRTRSALEISRAIEGRGGYCNAFTHEEMTCYYARVPSRSVWEVAEVLVDMYLAPRFDPADIHKERDVIIEEIMMYRDQPEQVVQEALNEMLWVNHSLGRNLIGTPETLSAISRQTLFDFKSRHYVPANTVLTFAGQVDHADCLAWARSRLGALPGGRRPVCRRVGGKVRQTLFKSKTKPVEQTQMALGFRLFGRADPRRHALRVLNVVFGENMSSRLFQAVREKSGLAYAIHSGVHLFRETGVLEVTAGLEHRRLARTLELTMREIRRLRERKIAAAEFGRALEYIEGQMRLSLETPAGCMMWAGEMLLNHGRVPGPETVLAEIRAVTPETVRQLAGQVLDKRAVSLSVLTSDKISREDAGIRNLLLSSL